MPLDAYRVLDLTDERGLLCGQMLADLGADVITVEPPGGSSARRIGPFAGDRADPEQSLFWWAYARNKRGITLDLAREDGRARLRELARGADVLVESFAPGYLDGLSLGYTALAAINPRLVMTSITPFGSTGPKAGWAASDLTVIAASGALLLTGDADRAPVRCAVPQAFLHAGAEAAVTTLIALHARERDRFGQHVDVSAQTAAAMATMSMILQEGWGEGPIERVAGGVKLGPVQLRFIFACKDGHVSISFLFGTAFGPFTRRLMEWVCDEGFIDAATRDKDWWNYAVLLVSGQEPMSELERLQAALGRFALAHTKAELFNAGLRRKLLIVPVTTAADVVHSEQLAARGYWRSAAAFVGAVRARPVAPQARHLTPAPFPGREGEIATWAGESGAATALYPGPFARLSATPISYRRPAPSLGEHNAEILTDTSPPAPPLEREGSTPLSSPPSLAGKGAGGLGPFAGLKVLDLTWAMVGPVSVRYLADYGATVVKVESTTHIDAVRSFQPFKDAQSGAERSGLFSNVNVCKLGVTINLTTAEGRALALRLVRWADVVAESFSPGAMQRWGLGYAALRELNPGLIMLSTCLSGQDGPQAKLAGFGTMGSALAGFGELTGWPDRAPAGPFAAYTDYVAPKFVTAALLAALDHRRRTGAGQYIDVSQVESALHFLTPALLDYTVNGRVQSRNGNAAPDHAPHGVYPAAGHDRWVAIACATDTQWWALCHATGNAAWAEDARFATFAARQANREALDTALGGWTAGRDVAAIENCLQDAGVPVHRVSSSADAFADPQLAHREHLVVAEHPLLGPVPLEASRVRMSRSRPSTPTTGPTYGQHTEQVLRQILQLSDEEIAALTIAGALE